MHHAGCRLDEESLYYLHFGTALAYLRKDEAEPALEQLAMMKRQWPTSADAYYNAARAFCLKRDIDRCASDFERALEIAGSRERLLFLRALNSAEDWIRRSETQSEFPPLRAHPRYHQIVTRARSR
jgi:tetratricopeptide (TPR) repeat protein